MSDFVDSSMEILARLAEAKQLHLALQQEAEAVNRRWIRLMHDVDEAEARYKDVLDEFEEALAAHAAS